MGKRLISSLLVLLITFTYIPIISYATPSVDSEGLGGGATDNGSAGGDWVPETDQGYRLSIVDDNLKKISDDLIIDIVFSDKKPQDGHRGGIDSYWTSFTEQYKKNGKSVPMEGTQHRVYTIEYINKMMSEQTPIEYGGERFGYTWDTGLKPAIRYSGTQANGVGEEVKDWLLEGGKLSSAATTIRIY